MTTTVLVERGAEGWTYKMGAAGHSAGFEDPSYDVSTWALGEAPFGIVGCNAGIGAPLAVATVWPSSHNDDICLRRVLGPSINDVLLDINIDDNVAVWMNGTLVSDPGAGTVSQNYVQVPIPNALLNDENVLAMRARDRAPTCAYFDCEITIEGRAGFAIGRTAIASGTGIH